MEKIIITITRENGSLKVQIEDVKHFDHHHHQNDNRPRIYKHPVDNPKEIQPNSWSDSLKTKLIIYGKEYRSLRHASKATGLSVGNICQKVNSKVDGFRRVDK